MKAEEREMRLFRGVSISDNIALESRFSGLGRYGHGTVWEDR
jgi:hypothetical protein